MVLRKEMGHLKDKAMGKDGLNSGSVPRSYLNFVADSKLLFFFISCFMGEIGLLLKKKSQIGCYMGIILYICN